MNTICIMCPMGCPLTVTEENNEIKVSGNTCKRGMVYGMSEYTRPVRTLTSIVKREGGGVVSVKTSDAFDKAEMMRMTEALASIIAPADCRIGDVLVKDILGLGVDLLVTGNPG